MTTQLGEAFVPIRATMDKLDGDLAAAKSKISGVLDNLGKIGGAALGVGLGAATAAVGALGVGLGLAISEAMGAQAVLAQTESVIKSTGGAAGMTAQAITDLAGAISLQSRFSDDAVQTAENLLLTFTNIGSDVFPQATQAMADMATAMGTDVSSGAIQLGKALNDPVAGISALTRVGVTFTDAQKKVIEALVKTGDIAGAQKIILAELDKEFGGSAKAAAETFAGKLDVLKNRLLNVAEAIGGPLLTVGAQLIDRVLTPAIPIIEAVGTALTVVIGDLASGDIGVAFDDLRESIFSIGEMLGFSQPQLKDFNDSLYEAWMVITTQVIPAVQAFIAQATPVITAVAAWLAQNVQLQDVLIALGVAIAAFVIPAIASVVAAAAPVILTFVAVVAVVALLRQAWESDFGGIQEKTAAVWAVVQPLLAQAVQWLQVNLPIAIEALRAWWVDVAWPAIQNAVAVAWPIIQAIFIGLVGFVVDVIIPTIANLWTFWTTVWWPGIIAALQSAWAIIQPILAGLVSFVVTTVIPTVLDLYTQWTTVWWPTISTALTNAWTIIETTFKELDRWINTNIIPWINELNRIWSTVVWPAIQGAVEGFWKVVQPVLNDVKVWLDTNIPVAVKALQPIFEGAMSGITNAVTPLKTLWDGFVSAVEGFWSWITSHTFNFTLNLPDLPAWAIPGSPLPIHTAWKAFAQDLSTMTIAPKVDMGGLLPVAALTQDGGRDQSVHYSSTTTVNTSADPLRVLRASRHLDRLGSLA